MEECKCQRSKSSQFFFFNSKKPTRRANKTGEKWREGMLQKVVRGSHEALVQHCSTWISYCSKEATGHAWFGPTWFKYLSLKLLKKWFSSCCASAILPTNRPHAFSGWQNEQLPPSVSFRSSLSGGGTKVDLTDSLDYAAHLPEQQATDKFIAGLSARSSIKFGRSSHWASLPELPSQGSASDWVTSTL